MLCGCINTYNAFCFSLYKHIHILPKTKFSVGQMGRKKMGSPGVAYILSTFSFVGHRMAIFENCSTFSGVKTSPNMSLIMLSDASISSGIKIRFSSNPNSLVKSPIPSFIYHSLYAWSTDRTLLFSCSILKSSQR